MTDAISRIKRLLEDAYPSSRVTVLTPDLRDVVKENEALKAENARLRNVLDQQEAAYKTFDANVGQRQP